jgi:hypothetical protein
MGEKGEPWRCGALVVVAGVTIHWRSRPGRHALSHGALLCLALEVPQLAAQVPVLLVAPPQHHPRAMLG